MSVPILRLSEIHIYPIKSARGIAVSAARVDHRGLEYDRRWMVVDNEGNFLTQRSIPHLALIHTQLRESSLTVTADGMDELLLPLQPESGKTLPIRVWKDSFEALDAGQEAAEWFTQVLSRTCRLVFMSDQTERRVNPKYVPEKAIVSFADAFPFMLISQASLRDLNSRLAEPVPMNRFRPNFVIEGCSAYEEDTWSSITMGSIKFRVAKPCSRCTVPTVNQDTGVRGLEPIRTLSSYRTMNGEIYFGQNLVPAGFGTLLVGDEVRAVLA